MQTQKKGFTLIELLVVIAIIGILSAIGLFALNGAQAKARDARRVADIGSIRAALALYADDAGGSFPAGPDECTVSAGTCTWGPLQTALVTGGYLGALPIPPQNQNSYFYISNGTDGDPDNNHYALYTTVERQPANAAGTTYVISDAGGATYKNTAVACTAGACQ